MSDEVNISIGYVSERSLEYIRDYIWKNASPKCNLLIGMHYFESFSYPQYAVAKETEMILSQKNLGSIRLVTTFPFHGKLYSFKRKGKFFSSIIGSSNLSNINPSNASRQYEVDFENGDNLTTSQIVKFQDSLYRCSKLLSEIKYEELNFTENNSRMKELTDVKVLTQAESRRIGEAIEKNFSIEIPLSDAPSSNLNPFFGKGRVNPNTQIERKRPWYEVELIVPKSITDLPWYPKPEKGEKTKEIEVVTDDGYQFKCKINGTNHKNFRSAGSLTILGKWIKGRLEDSKALTVNSRVTQDVFAKYGRNTITLTKTNIENTWYLDFSRGDN